jgi:hypothetical protein
MKKLIQLKGSVCGTRSHKIYSLISYNDLLYVFEVYSYDNSLELKVIKKEDYCIGENIFDKIMNDPYSLKYYEYENYIRVWRCSIVKEPNFMPDAYYLHLIQFDDSRIKQVESIKNNVKLRLTQLADNLDDYDWGFSGQIHLG